MAELIDITGNRYGKLIVLKYAGNGRWRVKCDCGNIRKMKGTLLRHDKRKSCGCNKCKKIFVDGISLEELATLTGIDYFTLYYRYRKNLSGADLVREPHCGTNSPRTWGWKCPCGSGSYKPITKRRIAKQTARRHWLHNHNNDPKFDYKIFEVKSMDPEEVLESLRGKDNICACGLELIPVIHKGKKIGETHKTEDDEDHHNSYFGSLRIKVTEGDE